MSNEQEAALHYPFGDDLPAPGSATEVAPGVLWLRMRLPFALDHINLWLLRDEIDGRPGWTVVDCGIANDETRERWEHIFSNALQGLPVLRVVATHMHPDHIGLAQWLTERWSTPQRECRLWISATDWHAAQVAVRAPTGQFGESTARLFARHGIVDEGVLAELRARKNYYASLVPAVPPRYRRLIDGMTLAIGGFEWRCIAGYGHAPEHMALYAPALGVLISGDMVLPRISTNVGVWENEPEADPLPLYLASIAAMRALPGNALVLPSHGKPFTGLHERIAQLEQHHEDRFADVIAACAAAPQSAAELLPVLFKRALDSHQLAFAMGEAIAHLHALAGRGRLRPVEGAGGVLRFAAA